MFQQPNPNRLGLTGMMIAVLLIFVFIGAVIFIAVSTLIGQSIAGVGAAVISSPGPSPTATIAPLGTVIPAGAGLTTFRSVALGVEFDYPATWRRQESSLRITLAPSPAGLEPGPLVEPTLWIGIPADNSLAPEAVLAYILANLPPHTKPSGQKSTTRAGIPWLITELSFIQADGQSGLARVAITSHNEVAYYLAVLAPAAQWSPAQAIFDDTLAHFRFTQEAIIRPTDASPPPTPTPSPTPRTYLVQPGDTLGGIAIEFGVTIEAIRNRNGFDETHILRAGETLIIPNQKVTTQPTR
jgi:LysM repeat protein